MYNTWLYICFKRHEFLSIRMMYFGVNWLILFALEDRRYAKILCLYLSFPVFFPSKWSTPPILIFSKGQLFNQGWTLKFIIHLRGGFLLLSEDGSGSDDWILLRGVMLKRFILAFPVWLSVVPVFKQVLVSHKLAFRRFCLIVTIYRKSIFV
jgi:hypothetical protein